MSVLKRGNSQFWYVQFQFQGKTYIKSSKTTDKRVAERIEREWRVKVHSHQYLGELEDVRFAEMITQFIETKEGTPSHSSLVSQSRLLNKYFPTKKKLHEIANSDLTALLTLRVKQGVANSTTKKSFDLIRGAWKLGKRLGYRWSDLEFPVLKLEKHRLRYLTIDEEKTFLKELDPNRKDKGYVLPSQRPSHIKADMVEIYDLVIVLLDTGARYSEIAKMEWTSINFDDHTLRLWRPKVRNESILYMTDRVHKILLRRYENRKTPYLFANKKGGPRNPATTPIRKAFKRANIKGCTVHTLRHTHATRLIQNGLSIYEVKEILGHTDISTTMRYAHLERREVSSRARDVINQLNTEANKPHLKVV